MNQPTKSSFPDLRHGRKKDLQMYTGADRGAPPKMTAAEAAAFISDGMTVAMSGYAMAGYPKAVVQSLVEQQSRDNPVSIHLVTGANVPWLDETLGTAHAVRRRTPMVAHRTLASQCNGGSVRYVEQQMCNMPRLLRRGSFGRIDFAIVEALGFDAAGNLIPTSSVGMTHHLLAAADQIIVEINTAQPEQLGALHDIHIPAPPPGTKPIPLTRVNQRIGTGSIPVDRKKIIGIVESDIPERIGAQPAATTVTRRIAGHLFDFLEREYPREKTALPPIQTGFGSIADSIVEAFQESPFGDLQFYCGGITEPVLELFSSGKARALSTGGLGMTDRVERILRTTPDLKDSLIIRNGDITNSAEVVARLGLIALNTGIEIDIYGNVNSSHVGGNRVVNGIGGGAGFARNAGLSVILIPSTAKDGAISNLVPMVSHQDIGEHDIDIVVTENGLADLRGLDDSERADAIVSQCSSDLYRGQLASYLHVARKRCGGHHPQLPDVAHSWYRRLKESGSMVE
jgi:succinyl-CoA:acetate CoA-transferase